MKDGFLVLRLPLRNPPKVSATGKTLVFASSRGGRRCGVEIDGKPLVVSVSAYVKLSPIEVIEEDAAEVVA